MCQDQKTQQCESLGNRRGSVTADGTDPQLGRAFRIRRRRCPGVGGTHWREVSLPYVLLANGCVCCACSCLRLQGALLAVGKGAGACGSGHRWAACAHLWQRICTGAWPPRRACASISTHSFCSHTCRAGQVWTLAQYAKCAVQRISV